MSIRKILLWNHLGIVDEVSLTQQLFETYGEETDVGTLVLINNPEAEKYVQHSPDICGFKNEDTLRHFELNKALTPINPKTCPYFDKVIESNIYKVSIDWEALRKYAGLLHDQEADQPFGQFKQKKLLKDALIREVERSGIKEVTITEKILGNYPDHVSTVQYIRGKNSPDHFIRFIETLKNLEKDGVLEVVETKFDFDACPIPCEEEMDRLEAGVFIDEDAYFYPAEHCMVTVRLKQPTPSEVILKKQVAEQALRPSSFTPRSILPVNSSAEEVIRSFSPQNYHFVLTVIKSILSLTDFSPDGKVHYQMQSPPGQLLIQERMLLDKLNIMGLMSHYGEDGIFGIVTLGNINVDVLREVESNLTNAVKQPTTKPTSVANDLLSRRGLEKKWDVLQAIWTVYESNSRADSVLIPVDRLTIKGRTVEEIDGIIDGLRNAGCFDQWKRKDRWYDIGHINHGKLPEIFESTKNMYYQAAKQYETEKSPEIVKKLPNKREMAKEVTRLKKVCSLGIKEAELLKILSNFEPKRTRELTSEIPTKDYKHLKSALAKKIIREGWAIKTDKGQGLNPDSFYILTRATPIDN